MSVGWDADPVVAAWPGLPSLPGDTTVDACVVGLGGSGLAAVAALVDRGLTVAGLDAGRVGASAAGRNGGFLIGGAAPFFHDTVSQYGAAAATALFRDTLSEIDRLADLLGPDVVRRDGSIRLAGLPGDPLDTAEAGERRREATDVAAEADALRGAGFPVEDYDGPLGTGLFLPFSAAVNPARRVLGEAAALTDRALLCERTTVTSVSAGTVTTDHGTVSAGVVIVAVDGRLEVLLPSLAGRVRSTRLQMVATDPVPPGRLPCPVYSRFGYDYAQQDRLGRLYVGGGRDRAREQEWTTSDEPTRPVQDYLDGLAARMAGRPVTVTHRWAAPVGYTADDRPLCVQVERGVIAVGGYCGTGNLMGPLAARAAVARALDGTPLPAWFRSELDG